MTTIISKVDSTGLKVRMNNQITVVYLYNDSKGEYFMNENLEKQYFKDTVFEKEEEEVEEEEVEEVEEEEELQDFRFYVEYEHKGRLKGFAFTETTVKAKSFDKAIEKVKRNFKTIYEISEA